MQPTSIFTCASVAMGTERGVELYVKGLFQADLSKKDLWLIRHKLLLLFLILSYSTPSVHTVLYKEQHGKSFSQEAHRGTESRGKNLGKYIISCPCAAALLQSNRVQWDLLIHILIHGSEDLQDVTRNGSQLCLGSVLRYGEAMCNLQRVTHCLQVNYCGITVAPCIFNYLRILESMGASGWSPTDIEGLLYRKTGTAKSDQNNSLRTFVSQHNATSDSSKNSQNCSYREL